MNDSTGDHKTPLEEARSVPIIDAVGMMLAHDVTEIRKDEFKGPAFRKGHIIRFEDIDHLLRIGKEHLFVLDLGPDDVHEDDAATRLAAALIGQGVSIEQSPQEGKVSIVATMDGLLSINRDALLVINMLGDLVCATRHDRTLVKQGRIVAAAKTIPLVVKRAAVERAVELADRARKSGMPVVQVKELRRPHAGVVITGNEIYKGRIADAFGPVITKKIHALGGEVISTRYAPDDSRMIETRLRELIDAGADILIATGGMSVDPDDVTRFAISRLGAVDITYGSPVLPGSMIMIGYFEPSQNSSFHSIPILGVPACGMYHRITVLDLILPRLLSGERIGRRELAELGHGGLCLHCRECRYPVCPFGR